MARKRKEQRNDNRPVLALQIGHTLIRGVYFRQEGGRIVDCQILEEEWQSGDLKLTSSEGARGLREALRRLLQRLPRSVDSAYIALSGEYCVTRVVSDTNENVQHEIREIESRSRLYLSLGHGPKVVAGNIYQRDPRHQHATVSVVHRQTVEVLLDVAKSCGLSITSIEPAVISLCRLMGAMGLTQEAPALLVCPGQAGVEIAIAYQGRLYLDYRPAGIVNQYEIAEVIVHHRQRFDRYWRRHAGMRQDSIPMVYITGQNHRSEAIMDQLVGRLDLSVSLLESDPATVAKATVPSGIPASHLPAIGVGLLAIREVATPGPNLMERLTADDDESIWPLLAKAVFPLAATLLIAIAAWGYLLQQRWELTRHVAEAAELEPFHREALLMQGKMTQSREKLNVHSQIAQQLPSQPLSAWLPKLSDVLPENAWLTTMALDDEGDLTLEGNALVEASVFDFAKQIGQLPFVTRASVEGVLPVSTKSGPAVKFTIECDLNDWVAAEGKDDGSV